jgi:transcriptional regulator with XRE-family HTH domain
MRRIRSLRDARANISQQELARRSDVDQQTISKIETGTIKEPSYRTVVRICKALGVRPDSIREFRV